MGTTMNRYCVLNPEGKVIWESNSDVSDTTEEASWHHFVQWCLFKGSDDAPKIIGKFYHNSKALIDAGFRMVECRPVPIEEYNRMKAIIEVAKAFDKTQVEEIKQLKERLRKIGQSAMEAGE